MGIQIDNTPLHTWFIADDQVVMAEVKNDMCYMLRKRKKEYEVFGL